MFIVSSLVSLTRFDLLLCHSSFPESILEFTCQSLHVTHTSSSCCATSLSFLVKVVLSHFLSWVSARRAGLLLDVERHLTASTATGVWLVVSLSEWGGTLSLLSEKKLTQEQKESRTRISTEKASWSDRFDGNIHHCPVYSTICSRYCNAAGHEAIAAAWRN